MSKRLRKKIKKMAKKTEKNGRKDLRWWNSEVTYSREF